MNLSPDSQINPPTALSFMDGLRDHMAGLSGIPARERLNYRISSGKFT